MFQKKITDSWIFDSILWYTLITSAIVILIDLLTFLKLQSNGGLKEILILTFFILLESVYFYLTIRFLKKKNVENSINIILFYWIAQTFFFGIKGNTYCFITGPNIAFFFKYLGSLKLSYLFRFWSQEFTINLNTLSDRIYFGFNLVPLMISTMLIYLLRKSPKIPLSIEKYESTNQN
jgi:hypothetical protein